MNKKFLLVSFDDERIGKLSETLTNKTCKKIVNFLIEKKEASQKDISDNLNIPMNTVDYSVKKLLNSGLIEKSKNFFWSRKGKKIINYKVSNTSIIISPKSSSLNSKFKSLFPVILFSAALTFAFRFLTQRIPVRDETSLLSAPAVSKTAEISVNSAVGNSVFLIDRIPTGTWFGIGAILVMLLFIWLNWRKL